MGEKEYLKINDVAKMVGVNHQAVRKWIKKGKGPAHRLLPSGHYLFNREDVEEWIRSMERSGASGE